MSFDWFQFQIRIETHAETCNPVPWFWLDYILRNMTDKLSVRTFSWLIFDAVPVGMLIDIDCPFLAFFRSGVTNDTCSLWKYFLTCRCKFLDFKPIFCRTRWNCLTMSCGEIVIVILFVACRSGTSDIAVWNLCHYNCLKHLVNPHFGVLSLISFLTVWIYLKTSSLSSSTFSLPVLYLSCSVFYKFDQS